MNPDALVIPVAGVPIPEVVANFAWIHSIAVVSGNVNVDVYVTPVALGIELLNWTLAEDNNAASAFGTEYAKDPAKITIRIKKIAIAFLFVMFL